MRDTADMFAKPERGRFGENEEAQVRPGRGPRVTGASDLRDFTVTLRMEKPLSIAVSEPWTAAAISTASRAGQGRIRTQGPRRRGDR